jgi:hypothetical protein
MKTRTIRWTLPLAIMLVSASLAWGQWGRSWRGGGVPPVDRKGLPEWEVDREIPKDIFTFVRIRYVGLRRGNWAIDYPDADLNFSYRLQQMTSLKVDPNGKVLELSDPDLFNYPFIYIVEPGYLSLSDYEVKMLRKYLLSGGFLMVDDFWGEYEWSVFYREIKRVFPEREPEDLPLEHPVFNIVFPLKEKPQVPSMHFAVRYQGTGITWERPDARQVNYRAIFDDKQRMMVMICHNTDLGDGWEREGESEYYFREFSEPKAYPMGINIIFYAMTQ